MIGFLLVATAVAGASVWAASHVAGRSMLGSEGLAAAAPATEETDTNSQSGRSGSQPSGSESPSGSSGGQSIGSGSKSGSSGSQPAPEANGLHGVAEPANWAAAPDLAGAVQRTMADFPGDYSIAVWDLTNDNHWSLGGELRHHPASTIKLPVTLYAMDQYRAGKLKWTDAIQYTKADFESPGGGAFETSPFGGWYPVENLVNRAIIYSNNVAVNMLGRHLGWQNIRDWSRKIGGELYREADASPSTTALNEVGWWRYLYQVSQQDPKAADLILGPLRQVAYTGRIAAGLPEGVPYVHKFGSYDGYFHDGAIIWGKHPYVLVVMTHGAEEEQADEAIAQVTAAIHQVMEEHASS
jgi:beta-lactamase class A